MISKELEATFEQPCDITFSLNFPEEQLLKDTAWKVRNKFFYIWSQK